MNQNETKATGFSLQEWAVSQIEAFDRQAEYVEHIAPLFSALHAACVERGFPMAAIVCHTQHEDGNNICASAGVSGGNLSRLPAEVLMRMNTDCNEEGIGKIVSIWEADQKRLALNAFMRFANSGTVN